MANSENIKRRNTLLLFAAICWLMSQTVFARDIPRRVIALAPNITEMVYRVGAGNLLVARTDYCLYPAAADSLPTVGAYLNPDFEKMVALQPDLVLHLPSPDLGQRLRALGFRTAVLPNETIAEILAGMIELGELIGHENEAAEAVQGIRDTLALVRERSSELREKAMIVIGREAGSLRGLYAAGQETYLSEILNLCGAENVFADVDLRYFDVSQEDLIARNPDLILELRIVDQAKRAAMRQSQLRDWQQLPVLQAVKSQQIYLLMERFFLIPGPRISKIAMAFYRSLEGLQE